MVSTVLKFVGMERNISYRKTPLSLVVATIAAFVLLSGLAIG